MKNEKQTMKIVLDCGAFMPQRAHPTDAGLDLFSTETKAIPPHGWLAFDTGVHVEIPHGYVGLITSKSGLMKKNGVTSRGTIDEGFTGSIQAVLFNGDDKPLWIERGQKITQLVVIPCITPEIEVVDQLEKTERGEGGFGSTGK